MLVAFASEKVSAPDVIQIKHAKGLLFSRALKMELFISECTCTPKKQPGLSDQSYIAKQNYQGSCELEI